MTARAFGQLGVLRDDAKVLGVGAGHEATVFWLTRHVGSVVATDLYMTDDAWSERDSGSTMLDDPGQYWQSEWNPERLTVKHMNGLNLEFDDESFDGVFSSSSIEHFGEFADVRRAVEEIYRVLKPGGVAALSTEFRLEGPSMNYHPGVLLFDEAEMRSLLFDGLWWDPASPFDASITEETRTAETLFMDAVADSKSGKERWSSYPHIVLRHDRFAWTSFHVALVKSGAPARGVASPRSRPCPRARVEPKRERTPRARGATARSPRSAARGSGS